MTRATSSPETAHHDPEHRDDPLHAGERALKAGNPKQALDLARVCIDQDENDGRGWALMGLAALLQGDEATAEQALERALALVARPPDNWRRHLADLYSRQRRWQEAAAVEERRHAAYPDDPDILWRLAALQPRIGDLRRGEVLTHRAVELQPVIYFKGPREDARFRVLQIVDLPESVSALRLNNGQNKVESTRSDTYVPVNNWGGTLDPKNIRYDRLYLNAVAPSVEDAAIGELPHLNAYSVIFCAIADADIAQPERLAAAAALCDRLGLPVVNHPRAVLQTGRHTNARRYPEWSEVIFPHACRLESPELHPGERIKGLMAEEGLRFPIIVRIPGYERGRGLARVDGPRQLAGLRSSDHPDSLLILQFYDTSDNEGFYYKYRAFRIGDQTLPGILLCARHWKVNRGMMKKDTGARARAGELQWRYNEDPAAVVGERAWSGVSAALAATGLDFCGVDFSVAADGRAVLYEMNAGMRSTLDPERVPEAYPAYYRAGEAFNRLLAERAGVDPEGLEPPFDPPEELDLAGYAARFQPGEVVAAGSEHEDP